MTHQLGHSSRQVTRDDLATIVAHARFLWECLDTEQVVSDVAQLNEQKTQSRLERWCQTAAQGHWDTLHKRLRWDGFGMNTVRPCLGGVQCSATQPLPDWAETLRRIMQTATEFTPHGASFLPIDSENPLPFEDLLLPAIKVARQQLLTQLGAVQLAGDQLPLSVLAEDAYRELERSLLRRLVELCSKTLDCEFSRARPFGQSLLGLLGLEAESGPSKTYYTQFINQLLQDGLLTFFRTYPVLGRFVATAVHFWVEFTTEFLHRLAQDRADIQRMFGATHVSLGKVATIHASLSDPHHRGRTVLFLTFESGLKLVYKPKNVGLEAAFNQFLSWCNRHGGPLDFKVIRVLNRDDYGWVEYVEHQPCMDAAAAERFYRRAGMLLCVLYVLRGTDCHYENLIASGEYLVLIDMEALMQHEVNLIEKSAETIEWGTTAIQHLTGSVLRTGLLPYWSMSSDRRTAYDISGLGSTALQQIPWQAQRWQAVNTDNMSLRYEPSTLPPAQNAPRLGDVCLSPNDYQAHITAGFTQMYRFLMRNKEGLLAADGPLRIMRDQQVRFLFRNTQVYGVILQNAVTPDYLKHGVDYSIELDRLSYAFLIAQEKPSAWPILSAELRAMEQLDIPYFSIPATSNALGVGNHIISDYIKQPSYQETLAHLQALNATDLARQVAIIEDSLYAKIAHLSPWESEPWEAMPLPILTTEQLVAEAREIATAIEARAIADPANSVNWIAIGYGLEAERFRLQVLDDSLYAGRCGVALFLAALQKVADDSHAGDMALRALSPLRRQVRTVGPESRQRMARLMGIGGASGVGARIYTFVKVSQFLGCDGLLRDAQALADWITLELITADTELDIIGGAAGAMLGLLALYEATSAESVLAKAIACGQHLLTHRYSHAGTPKAWRTIEEKPLTGFSHGAAGISYALLRLYAVTQDYHYLEAAMEGMEFEHSVFSQAQANWPDFRGLAPDQPPRFPVAWCHGAAGIGLGRLGSFGIVETPAMAQEIDIALHTTQHHGLTTIDHLCCGNLGLVEALLVGAQRCGRSDWRHIALHNATNVVARARRTGGYRLFANLPCSVFHPGFFRGTAGIGYELLRLAIDDLPSVLLWE